MRTCALLAGLLCAAAYGLLLGGMRAASATYDETANVPAGYSYLRWGDRRLNPEHPPLTKLLAALPLLSMGLEPADPGFTEEERRRPDAPGSAAALKRAWAAAAADIEAEWPFGHHFLYGIRPETLRRFGVDRVAALPTSVLLERGDFVNDADRVLFRARLAASAFWLLLAAFVFAWARALHGAAGGVLALALVCFDPNLLAHGALVTTDVAAAAFLFGTLYFLWRASRRLEIPAAAGFLACFALSFATKHTAVLLPLMCAAACAGPVLSAEPWPFAGGAFVGRARKAAVLLGLLTAGLLCAYAAVWACYGFRFEAARMSSSARAVLAPLGPGERAARMSSSARAVLAPLGPGAAGPTLPLGSLLAGRDDLAARAARMAWTRRLLPEAYLFGLAYAQQRAGSRGAFLLGERSERGWWYYFPVAAFFKTPLLSMLAVAMGLILLARRGACGELAFVAGPVLVYLAAALSSSLNIGHRHLLPVYPFLYLAAGALAAPWERWRPVLRRASAAAALLLIAASSSVVLAPPWRPTLVAPRFLSYFNELAGGPENGHRILVDSNLDWGQELGALGRWLERRGIAEPVGLCYFGMADPRYHRVAHVNLPGGYPFEPQEGFDKARVPGYVAISATHLQGAYFSPALRAEWARFLRDARLVDVLGGSILVYRL